MAEPLPVFAPLTSAQVTALESFDPTPECFVSMARAATKLKSRMTNRVHDIVSLGLKLNLPDKYQHPLSELPVITPSGYHFGQIIRVKPLQDNGHNYGRHTLMVVQVAGQSYSDGCAVGIFWNGRVLVNGNFLPECLPQDTNTSRAPYTSLTLEDFLTSLPAEGFCTRFCGDFYDSMVFLAKMCHFHYKL